jgi:hypothetical protein
MPKLIDHQVQGGSQDPGRVRKIEARRRLRTRRMEERGYVVEVVMVRDKIEKMGMQQSSWWPT